MSRKSEEQREVQRNRPQLWKLAEGLATGMTVGKAMEAAGYAKGIKRLVYTDENGVTKRLSPNKHPTVQEHVRKIQAEAVRSIPEREAERERRETERMRKVVVTIHDIVAKLETVFHGAVEDRAWAAASNAAMGQAKVLGLIVERREHSIKPVSQWTEAECLAALGEAPDDGRDTSSVH